MAVLPRPLLSGNQFVRFLGDTRLSAQFDGIAAEIEGARESNYRRAKHFGLGNAQIIAILVLSGS